MLPGSAETRPSIRRRNESHGPLPLAGIRIGIRISRRRGQLPLGPAVSRLGGDSSGDGASSGRHGHAGGNRPPAGPSPHLAGPARLPDRRRHTSNGPGRRDGRIARSTPCRRRGRRCGMAAATDGAVRGNSAESPPQQDTVSGAAAGPAGEGRPCLDTDVQAFSAALAARASRMGPGTSGSSRSSRDRPVPRHKCCRSGAPRAARRRCRRGRGTPGARATASIWLAWERWGGGRTGGSGTACGSR